jgi:hypothetical protein
MATPLQWQAIQERVWACEAGKGDARIEINVRQQAPTPTITGKGTPLPGREKRRGWACEAISTHPGSPRMGRGDLEVAGLDCFRIQIS